MSASNFSLREVAQNLDLIKTLIEFCIKDPDPELLEFALKIIFRIKKKVVTQELQEFGKSHTN